MNEDVTLQHARMCFTCGCTAMECGLPGSLRCLDTRSM